MKNSKKAAIEDLGESVGQLIKGFFDEKVRELDEETGENTGDSGQPVFPAIFRISPPKNFGNWTACRLYSN
jgi:hypothetical protein